MMPILDEMPKGIAGVKLLSWGARLAICGETAVMCLATIMNGLMLYPINCRADCLDQPYLHNPMRLLIRKTIVDVMIRMTTSHLSPSTTPTKF